MSLVIPILLLLGLIPLVLALIRANELVCVRARGDRVTVVRGRIPPRLLADISDILRRPGGQRATNATTATDATDVTLKIVVEDGRPRVYAEGELSDAQRQQLRNVVGMWPVAKMRNAPKG
jgi:hypothetical protein